MTSYRLYVHRCRRCNKDWTSRSKKPLRCGKCKSPYWDIPPRKSRR